jgi:hypothetical protein
MKEQDLILQRIFDNGESSIGYFVYNDFKTLAYTLEDTKRDTKIAGITRIPAGRYKLDLRVVMSNKTKQYRAKYDWFKWHIWLKDVPNFKYVYIHIGNSAKDSDGCILMANSPNNNSINDGFISSSASAFEKFYKWLFPKLHIGKEIYLEIRDEIKS